jgi:hypothetical protein
MVHLSSLERFMWKPGDMSPPQPHLTDPLQEKDPSLALHLAQWRRSWTVAKTRLIQRIGSTKIPLEHSFESDSSVSEIWYWYSIKLERDLLSFQRLLNAKPVRLWG